MQPTYFINHGGGPCFFLEAGPMRGTWHELEAHLRTFADRLDAVPLSILIVSGHWEEDRPTVNTGAAPPLLFDYYGFPPLTYELSWPAPGAPDVAKQVREALKAVDIDSDTGAERGWDHGVFVPLKVMFPDANIPVVQLSLQRGLDPEMHLTIGRALRPLRQEGVLILGSGQSYHNMEGMFGGPDPAAEVFDNWLREVVVDAAARDRALAEWDRAPAMHIRTRITSSPS